MSFPKGFLWGTSISAEQAEGAWDEGGKSPVQIDYAAPGSTTEHRKIYFLNKDGKKDCMPLWDHLPEGAKYQLFDDVHYTNHVACDFYHHWEEDLELFAEMGFTTFNTSLAWSRIYPYGKDAGVNKEGVDFYRKVFQKARDLGMDPVITLYKYDEPVWYEQTYGGWSNRAMIDEFVEFARVCFTEYKDLVNKWMTFNELNILLMVAMSRGNTSVQTRYEEMHNQMVASAKATIVAHEIDPNLKVGAMIAGICSFPLTSDPADGLANYRHFQKQFGYCADTQVRGEYPSYAESIRREDGVVLEVSEEDKRILKEGKADFLGFSYYSSHCVTTHSEGEMGKGNMLEGIRNPYLEVSDWGWAMDPVGYKYTLHFLNDRYDVPLFDVENGLGAFDVVAEDGGVHDPYRIDYLRNHIKSLKEAVEEGVNIFGYTTWGGLDLVSAGTGQMEKRYGMIYVDMNDKGEGDLRRIRKDSFYWYKKVCESNGEVIE
ncbi:MAG: glycoside hydrolase family 1 protein [Erysipelotrichaceae bacterium]|nr:glycoside hydrolase family 1 protein [Erysipelotrichaceae bacterium]